MKKTVTLTLCALMLSVSLSGCFTTKHSIGSGGSGQTSESKMQWYALWGLVPINQVDGGAMASGATDYTIKTQISLLNYLFSVVTGFVTVYSQTVTVTK